MPALMQSSLLSEEECIKIINKYTNEPFELVDFEIGNFSEDVVGFLADHFSLTVKFKRIADSRMNNVKFFVKTLPHSTDHSDQVTPSGIFNKEMVLYRSLLPKLLKLSSRPFAPRCYLAREKLMVLEDLKMKGYEMSDSAYLTYEQMTGLLKTIARFHASSIIYEEQKSTPEEKYHIIDHYKEELKETTFSFLQDHPRYKWAVTVSKCINDLMKLQTKYEYVEERCQKLSHIIFSEMKELIKPSKIFRNVINHDDLWCNNIMFNKENDAVIVDYQLARYVPPAYDVLMALYMHNTKDFLENNSKHLLEFYYNSLGEELRLHNIDLEDIYTKEQFIASVEFYRKPALIESVMYGTIIYISKDLTDSVVENMEVFNDFILVNRSKYVTKEYLQNKIFRDRFNEIFYPLIEYLDNYCQ